MENLKVSVIVPVYNRLEHLRALFICLLKQTEAPYELIISDDGSSEQVIDYIGDLLEEAKFKIKHIYQEDKGFRKTRALNNAVREAEGEILIFCDQDLIFPEKHIENIKKNMKQKRFLMGRPIETIEVEKKEIILNLNNGKKYEEAIKNINSNYILYSRENLKKDKVRRILNIFKLNKRGIKLFGMSYAMYKNDYIGVNGYDEKYIGWGLEDDDFGNRLYMYGVKGQEYIEEPIQLHLYHPFDPTKKHSANEEYYYRRKKEIFRNKDYFCEYGYNNSLTDDKIKVMILK